MNRAFLAGVVAIICCIVVGGFTADAAEKVRVEKMKPGSLQAATNTEAIETLDYFDPLGFTWSWNVAGPRYVGNIFTPAGGSYPLAIQRLEVIFRTIDGTGGGTIDGVGLFDGTGNLLAHVGGVTGASTGTWIQFPFASPYPEIAAGNFWGGGWQDTTASDRPLCGTATTGWTNANEPQATIANSATGSQFPVGWSAFRIGSGYPTASAAAVRAVIDTNVPVELMRFDVE